MAWTTLDSAAGLRAAAALLLLLPAVLSAQPERGQPDFRTRFQEGQAALQAGQFARAETEFRAALDAEPGLSEARVNLGLALFLQGKYQHSVDELEQAARALPALPAAHLFLGLGHLKLGASDEAIAALSRSLELDPANLEAHRALAACHLAKGDYASAVQEFQAAFSHSPDRTEAWYLLGRDYMGLMSDLAGRLVVEQPDSVWATRLGADMLALSEAWEAAANYYEAAVAKRAGLPGLHSALGSARLRLGQLDEAAASFEDELRTDPRSEQALLGLAEISLARGDSASALERVAAVWDSLPQWLGSQPAFVSGAVPPEFAAKLLRSLGQSEAGPAAFLAWALSANLGDEAVAAATRARFERAVQAAPVRSGGAAEAVSLCADHLYSACAQALVSRRSMTRAELLLLGRAYLALGQHERALIAFAHAMRGTDEAPPEAVYWTVRTLRSLADLCFEQVETLAPQSWRVHQLRAEAHRQRQADDEAIVEYRRAIELKPDAAELHRSLGLLYLLNNAYDEAERALEKALDLDGANPRSLYVTGRLFVARQQHAESIPYLETALQLDPNLVEARPSLGRAYLRVGRVEEAAAQLEQALILDYYGDIHYSLFQAYRRLGNMERARLALDRSTEMRKRSFARDRSKFERWIKSE